MLKLLNGKDVRDAIIVSLTKKIKTLPVQPTLVIVQVGDRPDSSSFIRQKKLLAESIGAKIIHQHYPETVSEAEILKDIQQYNADKKIHGIIVQIPLPASLNKDRIIESIAWQKDVDGLTAHNVKYVTFMPATARGILSLLDYYKIPIEGKNVTVVGRSALVGKPVALAFLGRNATVTITHPHTRDLASVCKRADILVVAIGQREFFTSKYISKGQVIIDVGINSAQEGSGKKIVGDVNFTDAKTLASAISPVPGGVGPMTVVSLFQNLVDAYSLQT